MSCTLSRDDGVSRKRTKKNLILWIPRTTHRIWSPQSWSCRKRSPPFDSTDPSEIFAVIMSHES